MIDPVHAAEWVAAGRAVLERAALGLRRSCPRGRDRDAIARRLDEAGRALELSNARLAADLGYPLCRCAFPPRPMLWDRARGAFVCREPGCGRTEPGG